MLQLPEVGRSPCATLVRQWIHVMRQLGALEFH